jgi:hypothetical protein
MHLKLLGKDGKIIKIRAEFIEMEAKKQFKESTSWAPVAHACNPSHSGGRDQENCSSKPAWADSSRDYLKKTHHKKGLVE